MALCGMGSPASRSDFGIEPFQILWQRVLDLVPRGFGGDPDVRERTPLRIRVERAEADAPDLGIAERAAVERRTAVATERPELARRRLVLGNEVGTRGDLEVLRSRRRVRRERGARSPLALFAVTEPSRPELAGDAVANATAEATTFEHCSSIPTGRYRSLYQMSWISSGSSG
jgi:hypothetical protein